MATVPATNAAAAPRGAAAGRTPRAQGRASGVTDGAVGEVPIIVGRAADLRAIPGLDAHGPRGWMLLQSLADDSPNSELQAARALLDNPACTALGHQYEAPGALIGGKRRAAVPLYVYAMYK